MIWKSDVRMAKHIRHKKVIKKSSLLKNIQHIIINSMLNAVRKDMI